MNKIKIVLADDHQILLDGLKSLLEKEEDVRIVGFYNNGLTLFENIKNTQPDIALIDINMPGLNGLELTSKITTEYRHIKVITLSMLDDITHIMQLVKAGVSGYLFKNTNNDELINAIYVVARGGQYFPAEVTRKITAYKKSVKNKNYDLSIAALTVREIEILKLIALEYSNEKIAEKLFISELTVATHRKNMLRKTNHKNMVGLIKYAIDSYLI